MIVCIRPLELAVGPPAFRALLGVGIDVVPGAPIELQTTYNKSEAIKSKDVVGDVRRRWQENPAKFEQLFDHCGRIAAAARKNIENGQISDVARLMQENQKYLEEMTVSSPELELLVHLDRQRVH